MRRLLQIPMLIAALLLIGAIGLHLLTGQPMLDCFYQCVILLTTVGSREPDPLTSGTKIFIMIYLTVNETKSLEVLLTPMGSVIGYSLLQLSLLNGNQNLNY